MLLDESIKEHNVDGRIICTYRYIKRMFWLKENIQELRGGGD